MSLIILPPSSTKPDPSIEDKASISSKKIMEAAQAEFSSLLKAKLTLEWISSGTNRFTFLLNGLASEKLILKLICESEDGETGREVSSNPFEKDQWIYQSNQSRVPIPPVRDIGSVGLLIDGKEQRYRYILQEYYPYQTASQLINSPGLIVGFAKKLGEVVREIHSIAATGYGCRFTRESCQFSLGSWSCYFDQLIVKSKIVELFDVMKFSVAQCDRIIKQLESIRSKNVASNIFHQDVVCNWGNVLVDPVCFDIKAIIDWEFSGAGDALLMDVGEMLCSMYGQGFAEGFEDTFLRNFLDGYGISWDEYIQVHKAGSETIGLMYAASRLLRRESSPVWEYRQNRIRAWVQGVV